jgi:phenylalanyl-tRNA synthetase beta chain
VHASYAPTEHPALHPGRAAEIRAGEDADLIGYFGEIHPLVRQQLDLPSEPVLVAELDLECLARHGLARRRYQSIRRFPSVQRQLTVALAPGVTAEQARGVIQTAGGDLLVGVSLADVFQLPGGNRSLSYSFVLQSDEKTLTDEEANAVRDRIMDALKFEVGAVQR